MVPDQTAWRVMAIVAAADAGTPAHAGDAARVLAVARYAEGLARAGVDVVQLRDPAMPDGLLRRAATAMSEAMRGTGVRLLVNDRAHVAMAAGVDGVHLREVSMPAPRVRAVVGPRALIGRSVHRADDPPDGEREGLDYVIFGTVFATSAKPDGPVAGLDALAEACRRSPVPVLAVGGISVERCAAVAAAGAQGVAGIGVFAEAWRVGRPTLDARVKAMRAAAGRTEAGR